MARAHPKTLVVIGNGMVGHRFCERLVALDVERTYRVVTFCEEPRPAYDRVNLTKYFECRDPEKLRLADPVWYDEHGITLYVGEKATSIDRDRRVVCSNHGREIPYDIVVLATGSSPFVPPVPGINHTGVFVYRTIEDLDQIAAYSRQSKRAAVIGGGLLGLEAAKAAYDLGLETHVVEFASRLMPRQIDDAGSRSLVSKIEALGVHVHLNKSTQEIIGDGKVEGMLFADGGRLDVDMIIVSAGIKPRDDLARACGLDVGQRGGVMVDEFLRTSDAEIFAIGEAALFNGMIYGLVAPGYEMAEILAANLCGEKRRFTGADMSTKLKLMGVDVASFGNAFADEKSVKPLVLDDPFKGAYRKLLFRPDGQRLVGGILVGDASDYGMLSVLVKSDAPLAMSPQELLVGAFDTGNKSPKKERFVAALSANAQICSCNNVSKERICAVICEQNLSSVDEVKKCTKAGTGCGGCLPLVVDLFHAQLEAAGKKITNHLCEHFAFTRQELFQIVKIKAYKTFDALLKSHGTGHGCEICKPAIASILASLWNENIVDQTTIQDTNDRFLANMQRGGLYSVVPRVPGGEITPDKLIALGRVAKKYGLYTKITGGQRIDLFGAQVHQLPEIWEELIAAGFESGHAYGKAMRTVKSCVGTTWCRYGVQDSVRFAVRIENRYKGLRAPHKLKAAVSGCVRECAEAQCKDFGLIATEKGYNLYVCGNGGAKPRHADLLAADLDEDAAIQYIDRFLMYYIQTADRLARTSVWLEKLEGGIDYLRDVIINDRLGFAADLERQMAFLVDTYKCEWREVVHNPEKRRLFKQFVNTEATEPTIEFVQEREQRRPADWPREFVPLEALNVRNGKKRFMEQSRNGAHGHEPAGWNAATVEDFEILLSDYAAQWVHVGNLLDFPENGGAAIRHGRTQIAVFNFASRGEWYACQNMCPHKSEFVLSRGIIGDQKGTPKVACPLHKKTFSLESGTCLSGEELKVQVFPVRVNDHQVFVFLPPEEQLDELLATEKHCNRACELQTA